MAKLLIILLFGLLSLSNHSYCQASTLVPPDSTLKIFSENDKKGIKNTAGEVVLSAIYDQLGWSDKRERKNIDFLGYKKDHLWGLLSPDLQPVTPTKYSTLYPLNKEFFVASLTGKYSKTNFYGLIDGQGKTEIEFNYRNLIPAGEYLIAAARNKDKIQFGLINSNGKEILPFNYFQIRFLGSNKFEITHESNLKSLVFIERRPETILQNFDSISEFKNGVAIIYKAGKQGLISDQGKILLSIKYKNIEWNNGQKIYVTSVSQWEIFDKNAQSILKAEADTTFFLNDTLLVKNTSDFSELYHQEAEETLSKLKGRFLGSFAGQFILKTNNKAFLINPDSTKDRGIFEGNVNWNSNYFIAEKQKFNGKYFTLYSASGKEAAADTFKLFPNSIALKRQGYWGLYDVDFQEIIPSLYDEIIPTESNQIIVKFRGEFGVVNEKNEWVFTPKYREIKELSPGTYKGVNKFLREFIMSEDYQKEAKMYYDVYDKFLVESDAEGKSRFVNLRGQALSPFFKGEYAGHNSTGVLFKDGKTLKYFNGAGAKLFQIENYYSIILVEDEFFPIVKDGQHGFVDQQGLLRVANRYDAVRPYQNDMAAIKIRNNWGFIDRREVLQIQPYFKTVSDFKNGVALVNYNNKYGLINKDGKYLLEANYDEIELVGEFYLLKRNSKWGAATSSANIIAHPNYDAVEVMGDYLKVKQYSKYKILDGKGNTFLQDQYDEIVFDPERQLFLCKTEASTKQVFLTDLLKGEEP